MAVGMDRHTPTAANATGPDEAGRSPRATRAAKPSGAQMPSERPRSRSSWWSLPQPIRRVFDRFPLRVYPANTLPQRAPQHVADNVLYIFQTADPQSRDAPSFNPSCLKWQAYLKFHGIPLRTRASNNHASPSGSLPFLLPASDEARRPSSPVVSNRIQRWVVAQGGKEEKVHMRQEAYTALIDHPIRNAYLHYLYLDANNFHAVAWPLYVAASTSSSWVRVALAAQLRDAAKQELLKTHPIIDPEELYHGAAQAFRSLAVLLGDDEFFFGQTTPGLFDASLFAYTQVLLSDHLDWQSITLKSMVEQHPNLVQHRARLMRGFFSG